MPKRTQLSEAERDQRRAADRAFVQQAVEQLRSSDGWQRWLATRRHFHTYSLRNQLLLAMQNPDATRVTGFKDWLAMGYCVRRGEKALRIFAPCPPSKAKLKAWRAPSRAAGNEDRVRRESERPLLSSGAKVIAAGGKSAVIGTAQI